jgi:4-carboxymuconolactone decarboxylase
VSRRTDERGASNTVGEDEMTATLPKDIYPESLSRLPLLGRDEMDAEGQRFYDAAVSPQSRTLVGLRGPGGIWLHSPKLGAHVREANQYLRYASGLDRRLTELAILVTARECDSQFEWAAHEPQALKDGLEPAIVDTVKHRKPIGRMGRREATIIRFGREAIGDRKVRSRTFAGAVELFGRTGVVNLAALMGNYAATAIMLTAVDQRLHPGQQPLLPPRGTRRAARTRPLRRRRAAGPPSRRDTRGGRGR